MVVEEKLEVPTRDGAAEAYVYRPDASGGPWPGAIMYTDIAGIRPAYHRIAQKLSEQGFVVLFPNIFYRVSRLPVFDFTPRMGDERTMKRLGELRSGLNAEQMLSDGASYTDFLFAQKGVMPGKAGVVGYCFTGSMAMRTAAARPERIGAAVSFHGGGLATDQPESPHLLLPRIEARLYFGHAIEDRSMPAEAIVKLEAALKAWGRRFESETYEGARHGWTHSDSPVYNEAQAERAFAKLTALFKEML